MRMEQHNMHHDTPGKAATAFLAYLTNGCTECNCHNKLTFKISQHTNTYPEPFTATRRVSKLSNNQL